MRVSFCTLGCKVNQYETDALKNIFFENGYTIVDFEEYADVYVINTCTVTNLSDRKSRQMIRKAKKMNSNSIVIVIGCYAQSKPEILKNMPEVDIVIGTSKKSKIIDILDNYIKNRRQIIQVNNILKENDFENLNVGSCSDRTRAYLKIQEGCQNFCTYCIIPFVRGPSRSRKFEDIVSEISKISQLGYKEVVITGTHVAYYGKDLDENKTLIDVIIELNKNPIIERIRLSSIEPGYISNDVVKKLSNVQKLCPHFHLSLQSGSDSVLARMNRRYSTYEYLKEVETIREHFEDASITTDIIVGFPGETDAEFEETCKFVKDIRFSRIHIFRYSRRDGTKAAEYENQVDEEIKQKRIKILNQLAKKCEEDYCKKFLNCVRPVLFEQEFKEISGFYEGYTTNYIKTVCKGNDIQTGEIIPVLLMEFKDGVIFAKKI